MRSLLLAVLAAAPAAASPKVEVRLDPRVELAAALHLQAAKASPLPGFADDRSDYARALDAIGAPASRHPAVDAYRRALKRPAAGGAGYMTPLRELTSCLDASLRVVPGPACARSPLAAPAAAFAAKTRFAARWAKEARPLLDARVKELESARDRADYVALFEEYSGLPAPCSYAAAPSPLLSAGLFWNGLAAVPGGCAITTVISPSSSTSRFDWLPVMRDVWHEEGHALLDPWLDAAPSTGALARPALSGAALEGCYGSWPQCVREHAAQGVSAAILDWAKRGRRLPEYADPHLKESLPLLPKVVERLREYEDDRTKWKDLKSFYPRILDVLEGPAGAPASVRAHEATSSTGGADRDAGVSAFREGRKDEAAALLARAVAADPRLADAWLSLSVVEAARGRAADALASAGRAVDLAREDGELPPHFLADALSNRADLRAASGDAAGARADREEALDAAPADWPRAAELRKSLKR